MKQKYRLNLIPWALLALVAILYLCTLDRGLRPDELTGGDLITHQYAQAQARPSNAPGYPLYVLLGWGWFKLARLIGSWALNPVQLLSAYSALWGLAAVAALYKLFNRRDVTGATGWMAGLLALFYAVTYFFWYYSVTTEQYTSAIFQTVLVVYLVFQWEEAPTNRILLGLAFLCGTMAANMLTTLFILPPLLYLIFTRRPDILKNPKLMAQATLAGLLPLTGYAYVYIRGAQHPEWRGEGQWASTAQWFWQFISTQQGRDELAPGLTWHHLITPEYPALVWGELSLLVVLGGLIGWVWLGKRKAIFLYGTLAIYLIFTTAYRFGNWFQVILPVYPLLVLGFGRFLTAAADWLSAANRPWANRAPARLRNPRLWVAILLVTLIGWRFSASLIELQNHRHNTPADTGLAPGWAVQADVAGPGWSISPDFEEWLALQYLHTIWLAQPDIQLQRPGSPAEYVTRRAAGANPALVNPAIAHPQAVGATLIRLLPAPMTDLPAEATPAQADFGGQMRLIGYRLSNDRTQVTLYWTAPAALTADYTISARLWQNGAIMGWPNGACIQDHQPVWNTYPTSRWRPAEIVADAYTFDLPPATRPEQLQLVVYRPVAGGFENLGETLITLPPQP